MCLHTMGVSVDWKVTVGVMNFKTQGENLNNTYEFVESSTILVCAGPDILERPFMV